MPGYISTKFYKYQHKPPARSQDDTYLLNKHVYGKHIQLAIQQSYAPKLNSADTNCMQSINITLLQFAYAVDPTMFPYLN